MSKSAGKIIKSAAKQVANTATVGLYGAATSHSGNFFENAASNFGSAVSGLTLAKTSVQEGAKVVGDLTGATAAQEGLKAQIEQSQAEARRQALLSDAMARDGGGDSARISLNTGKNRKGSGGASGTGIGGVANSNSTGVQS